MIEVLRQARNAFVWNLNTDLDNIPACDQWAKMLRKNIDDLDKAIAELESQGKTMKVEGPLHVVCQCDKCKTESQEPVALPCCGYRDANAVKWNPLNDVVQCHNCGQTYTPPPQRTWVGLTADEQSFVYDQVKQIVDSKPFWVRFADAIEAKLKEKNNV